MEKAEANLELIRKYFPGLSQRQMDQFAALNPLYREWNSRINVISRKDIEQLYEGHVLHSLSIAAAFAFAPGDHVIDIGTGGGFPGIPLAICFPQTRFHLVDSTAKKIRVVQVIAAAIGLENITTAHARVEEIRGQKFDCAVSRAVAPLGKLWSWSKPILRQRTSTGTIITSGPGEEGNRKTLRTPNGLICLKGGDLQAEIVSSRTKPAMISIHDLFPLDLFREKYILYLPYGKPA